jgi:signal transduction histidine kinase
MAKKNLADALTRQGRRVRWRVGLFFGGLMALQAGAFALIIGLIWGEKLAFWLPELLIGSVFLLFGGVLTLAIVYRQERTAIDLLGRAAKQETDELTTARNEANALKALSAAIGSARDVDGLFDITLDIYQLALNDFGVPTEDQVNVIYLLGDDHLTAAAARGPVGPEDGARLDRQQGITGRALAQAELLIGEQPGQDPALSALAWLQGSQQVICAPLCTAHGLSGLVLLAMKQMPALSADDIGLLEAITDQVAMALHSFQLQQNLREIGIAYLAAEEDERELVRQALHQGPSRAIAAVALRLGLIRTMMIKDPDQAALELGKLELQTRQASEELRDLVIHLRPMDLAITDFDRAVDATLRRIEDELGLALRVGRRAADGRLSPQAMAMILYVLEGSLAWARKHFQATAAEVSYWAKGDRFYLSVDDDGYSQVQHGGQPASRGDDLATGLMRARIARVGGRLEVTSKPGRGMSTVVTAPLGQQGWPPEA